MKKQADDVIIHRVGKSKKKKANPNAGKPTDTVEKNAGAEVFDRQFARNIKIISLLVMAGSLLLLIALATYTSKDEALLDMKFTDMLGLLKGDEQIIAKTEMTGNWLGLLGAWISNYLYNYTFGYAAFFIPFFSFYWAYDLFRFQKIEEKTLKNTMLYLCLALLFSGICAAFAKFSWGPELAKEFSGIVGYYIAAVLSGIIGAIGAMSLLVILVFTALYFGFGIQFELIKHYINKAAYSDKSGIKSFFAKMAIPYQKLLEYTKRDTIDAEDSDKTESDKEINDETGKSPNAKNAPVADSSRSANMQMDESAKIERQNPYISTTQTNFEDPARIIRNNFDMEPPSENLDYSNAAYAMSVSDSNAFIGIRSTNAHFDDEASTQEAPPNTPQVAVNIETPMQNKPIQETMPEPAPVKPLVVSFTNPSIIPEHAIESADEIIKNAPARQEIIDEAPEYIPQELIGAKSQTFEPITVSFVNDNPAQSIDSPIAGDDIFESHSIEETPKLETIIAKPVVEEPYINDAETHNFIKDIVVEETPISESSIETQQTSNVIGSVASAATTTIGAAASTIAAANTSASAGAIVGGSIGAGSAMAAVAATGLGSGAAAAKPLNIYLHDTVEEDTIKAIPKNPLSILSLEEKINYKYPTIEILDQRDEEHIINEEELKLNAKTLQEKLETFKIVIENLTITPGPVVTQYEFVPAPGIKISRIENLSDDIAMALKARGIRIIAPVPGKGTVGIEIPNQNPATVRFSSIIKSAKFHNNNMKLPLAMGKTINGEVYITDLAKMPHLLIAGSTGSGKSVGINTIIASLLYKLHPRNLKFVIIDPKKVELRQYEALTNHFLALSPDINDSIITDPQDAVIVLKALCSEMDQRYDILASVGQRNIADYNEKVLEGKIKDSEEITHRPMPYIVVIIDELADLMLTASKEVETPIIRLAQLARAVGIHLVVATQRPSVDVITGIIKANFPARASYLVASKIDSRTILDVMGAEQLLGNGDMLFLAGGSPKPIRMQNAFVSTDEVEAICEYIGSQRGFSEPYYLPSIAENAVKGQEIDKSDRDPLFEEAARLVVRHQTASVSLVQRRLKVGYARAGRIIDELEAAGVVGPFDGSKSRSVFMESEMELEAVL
jgi:S-DNA-T family DNA segregation ATPase FtsK/SpoIIIE